MQHLWSCFEMLYLDEDAQIRFAKVAPSDLIMIYESDSGHAQPMAADQERPVCR